MANNIIEVTGNQAVVLFGSRDEAERWIARVSMVADSRVEAPAIRKCRCPHCGQPVWAGDLCTDNMDAARAALDR